MKVNTARDVLAEIEARRILKLRPQDKWDRRHPSCWDFAERCLAALRAAGLAVVPVEPLRKVARGDCSVFSSDPDQAPSWIIYEALGGRAEEGKRLDEVDELPRAPK